jgi:putative ubiquitin-RnfH superfamily antitoxin RatB of RatAB toxin-antitoxin module
MKEKLKAFAKKLINKKTITGAVIVIILAVALRITFLLKFEVEGVVNQVDGSKITVANFLTTQTVDIGNFKTADSSIQVGDRIEIMKNLSGDVISVRDFNVKNMNEIGKGKRNIKGIGENTWKGK